MPLVAAVSALQNDETFRAYCKSESGCQNAICGDASELRAVGQLLWLFNCTVGGGGRNRLLSLFRSLKSPFGSEFFGLFAASPVATSCHPKTVRARFMIARPISRQLSDFMRTAAACSSTPSTWPLTECPTIANSYLFTFLMSCLCLTAASLCTPWLQPSSATWPPARTLSSSPESFKYDVLTEFFRHRKASSVSAPFLAAAS